MLAPYRPEDRDAFLRLVLDPALMAHVDGPADAASAAALFARIIAPDAPEYDRTWAIRSRASAFVGHIWLTPSVEAPELGFVLARAYWNRGLASQAARARARARDIASCPSSRSSRRSTSIIPRPGAYSRRPAWSSSARSPTPRARTRSSSLARSSGLLGSAVPWRSGPEEPADRAAIHAVHAESFPTQGEAQLVDALRAAGRPVHLAGGRGGGRGRRPRRLQPAAGPRGRGRRGPGTAGRAARLPAARHRGPAWCARACCCARKRGHGFVVLVGNPAYYRRFGFLPARERALHYQEGVGDAFQTLELRPGAIPARGGTVAYAPEFDALDE